MKMEQFDANEFSGLSFDSEFESLLGLNLPATRSTGERSSGSRFSTLTPQNGPQGSGSSFIGSPQCAGCARYKADLDRLDHDHRVNFQFLKKKVISTDLLIRRFKAKQDECELQGKTIESLNQQLDKVTRDSSILSDQLKAAMEQVKPLEEEKDKVEKELRSKSQQLSILKDRLEAEQAFKSQKSAWDDFNKNLESEMASVKRQNNTLSTRNHVLESNLKDSERERKSLSSKNNLNEKRLMKLAVALKEAQDVFNKHWGQLKANGLVKEHTRPSFIPDAYKSLVRKAVRGNSENHKDSKGSRKNSFSDNDGDGSSLLGDDLGDFDISNDNDDDDFEDISDGHISDPDLPKSPRKTAKVKEASPKAARSPKKQVDVGKKTKPPSPRKSPRKSAMSPKKSVQKPGVAKKLTRKLKGNKDNGDDDEDVGDDEKLKKEPEKKKDVDDAVDNDPTKDDDSDLSSLSSLSSSDSESDEEEEDGDDDNDGERDVIPGKTKEKGKDDETDVEMDEIFSSFAFIPDPLSPLAATPRPPSVRSLSPADSRKRMSHHKPKSPSRNLQPSQLPIDGPLSPDPSVRFYLSSDSEEDAEIASAVEETFPLLSTITQSQFFPNVDSILSADECDSDKDDGLNDKDDVGKDKGTAVSDRLLSLSSSRKEEQTAAIDRLSSSSSSPLSSPGAEPSSSKMPASDSGVYSMKNCASSSAVITSETQSLTTGAIVSSSLLSSALSSSLNNQTSTLSDSKSITRKDTILSNSSVDTSSFITVPSCSNVDNSQSNLDNEFRSPFKTGRRRRGSACLDSNSDEDSGDDGKDENYEEEVRMSWRKRRRSQGGSLGFSVDHFDICSKSEQRRIQRDGLGDIEEIESLETMEEDESEVLREEEEEGARVEEKDGVKAEEDKQVKEREMETVMKEVDADTSVTSKIIEHAEPEKVSSNDETLSNRRVQSDSVSHTTKDDAKDSISESETGVSSASTEINTALAQSYSKDPCQTKEDGSEATVSEHKSCDDAGNINSSGVNMESPLKQTTQTKNEKKVLNEAESCDTQSDTKQTTQTKYEKKVLKETESCETDTKQTTQTKNEKKVLREAESCDTQSGMKQSQVDDVRDETCFHKDVDTDLHSTDTDKDVIQDSDVSVSSPVAVTLTSTTPLSNDNLTASSDQAFVAGTRAKQSSDQTHEMSEQENKLQGDEHRKDDHTYSRLVDKHRRSNVRNVSPIKRFTRSHSETADTENPDVEISSVIGDVSDVKSNSVKLTTKIETSGGDETINSEGATADSACPLLGSSDINTKKTEDMSDIHSTDIVKSVSNNSDNSVKSLLDKNNTSVLETSLPIDCCDGTKSMTCVEDVIGDISDLSSASGDEENSSPVKEKQSVTYNGLRRKGCKSGLSETGTAHSSVKKTPVKKSLGKTTETLSDSESSDNETGMSMDAGKIDDVMKGKETNTNEGSRMQTRGHGKTGLKSPKGEKSKAGHEELIGDFSKDKDTPQSRLSGPNKILTNTEDKKSNSLISDQPNVTAEVKSKADNEAQANQKAQPVITRPMRTRRSSRLSESSVASLTDSESTSKKTGEDFSVSVPLPVVDRSSPGRLQSTEKRHSLRKNRVEVYEKSSEGDHESRGKTKAVGGRDIRDLSSDSDTSAIRQNQNLSTIKGNTIARRQTRSSSRVSESSSILSENESQTENCPKKNAKFQEGSETEIVRREDTESVEKDDKIENEKKRSTATVAPSPMRRSSRRSSTCSDSKASKGQINVPGDDKSPDRKLSNDEKSENHNSVSRESGKFQRPEISLKQSQMEIAAKQLSKMLQRAKGSYATRGATNKNKTSPGMSKQGSECAGRDKAAVTNSSKDGNSKLPIPASRMRTRRSGTADSDTPTRKSQLKSYASRRSVESSVSSAAPRTVQKDQDMDASDLDTSSLSSDTDQGKITPQKSSVKKLHVKRKKQANGQVAPRRSFAGKESSVSEDLHLSSDSETDVEKSRTDVEKSRTDVKISRTDVEKSRGVELPQGIDKGDIQKTIVNGQKEKENDEVDLTIPKESTNTQNDRLEPPVASKQLRQTRQITDSRVAEVGEICENKEPERISRNGRVLEKESCVADAGESHPDSSSNVTDVNSTRPLQHVHANSMKNLSASQRKNSYNNCQNNSRGLANVQKTSRQSVMISSEISEPGKRKRGRPRKVKPSVEVLEEKSEVVEEARVKSKEFVSSSSSSEDEEGNKVVTKKSGMNKNGGIKVKQLQRGKQIDEDESGEETKSNEEIKEVGCVENEINNSESRMNEGGGEDRLKVSSSFKTSEHSAFSVVRSPRHDMQDVQSALEFAASTSFTVVATSGVEENGSLSDTAVSNQHSDSNNVAQSSKAIQETQIVQKQGEPESVEDEVTRRQFVDTVEKEKDAQKEKDVDREKDAQKEKNVDKEKDPQKEKESEREEESHKEKEKEIEKSGSGKKNTTTPRFISFVKSNTLPPEIDVIVKQEVTTNCGTGVNFSIIVTDVNKQTETQTSGSHQSNVTEISNVHTDSSHVSSGQPSLSSYPPPLGIKSSDSSTKLPVVRKRKLSFSEQNESNSGAAANVLVRNLLSLADIFKFFKIPRMLSPLPPSPTSRHGNSSCEEALVRFDSKTPADVVKVTPFSRYVVGASSSSSTCKSNNNDLSNNLQNNNMHNNNSNNNMHNISSVCSRLSNNNSNTQSISSSTNNAVYSVNKGSISTRSSNSANIGGGNNNSSLSQQMLEARKMLAKRKSAIVVKAKPLPVGKSKKRNVEEVQTSRQCVVSDKKQKLADLGGFPSAALAIADDLGKLLADKEINVKVAVERILTRVDYGNAKAAWDLLLQAVMKYISTTEGSSVDQLMQACETEGIVDSVFLSGEEKSLVHLLAGFMKLHKDADRHSLMSILWTDIFRSDSVKESVRLSLCRLFTCLCMEQGDVEEARVLVYNIGWCGYLSLAPPLMAIVGVWPAVLSPSPFTSKSAIRMVLELMLRENYKNDPAMFKKVCKVMMRVCQWDIEKSCHKPENLLENLQQQLRTFVQEERHAEKVFESMKALELLLVTQGPAWSEEYFVKRSLMSVAMKWGRKGGEIEGPSPGYVASLLGILRAYVSVQKLSSSAVGTLLGAVLTNIISCKSVIQSVELACGEALLDLVAFSPERCMEVFKKWQTKNKGNVPPQIFSKLLQTRSILSQHHKAKSAVSKKK